MAPETIRGTSLLGYLLLCCCLISLVSCSGDGNGEFNLDKPVGERQTRILTIQPDAGVEVAAIQFKLPFGEHNIARNNIFSSISLLSPEEDAYLEFAEGSDKTVDVAILSGRREGFRGQVVTLELNYTVLGTDSVAQIPFETSAIHKVKVLDTGFYNQIEAITLHWEETRETTP